MVRKVVADAEGALDQAEDAVEAAELGSCFGVPVLAPAPVVLVYDLAVPVEVGFEMFVGASDPRLVGLQEVAAVDAH